jgi:hypothetical protein
MDLNACLDPDDKAGLYLMHSLCRNPITLDGPLRLSGFVKHHNTCKIGGGMQKNAKFREAAQGCTKINTIFANQSTHANAPARQVAAGPALIVAPAVLTPPPKLVLCHGLQTEHDERVQGVLDYSG